MKTRVFFPLGKAYGDAFCNREDETARLVGHIEGGKHTLLIAPRRYGKSSLAEKAMAAAGYPHVRVNFHLCTSIEEVTELVVNHVVKLIGLALGPVEKLVRSMKQYLANWEPTLSFGNDIANLTLTPKKQLRNDAVLIAEALLLIEKLLRDKGARAILFLDEFQEISRIADNHVIEGAFRTAAQEMSHLSIIFSGSIRSLLLSMFEDENRPLYKLCRKIKLERIAFDKYQKHIQKIAMRTWGQALKPEVFERIMELSNRHPYYVNYLCDELWSLCRAPPRIAEVDQAWKMVLTEEWGDALKELSVLPIGQRRVLNYIANQEVKSLQSQEVCKQLSMPSSSIATALNVLVTKDYVEKNEQQIFKPINPLLLSVLKGLQD